MAITYSHCKPPICCHPLSQNPAVSISLNRRSPNCAGRSTVPAELFGGRRRKRSLSIVAAIGNGGILDTPLELTSSTGRSLGNVLLNDPYSFFYAVSAELNGLAVDRDGALDRMELSFGKPEACLHRRIAEMKEAEHESIIADIIYMIIYKKFKDINVPLTPRIDKDLCYNTWNTSASDDVYDLKSIHSHEVMDIIQDFLHSVVWLKAESIASIRLDPTMTNMVHLSKIYSTSVNYGYFLKSVSFRFSLEQYMSANNKLDILPSNSMPFALGSGDIALGEFSAMRSRDMTRIQSEMPKPPRLKGYVRGLDKTAMRVCKELRSQISSYLIQDHCFGLFSVKEMDSYEPFLISLANLERLVWEAIAFGCFLWDADEYVDRVYNLRKNLKSTRMV